MDTPLSDLLEGKSSEVVTVTPDTTVAECVRVMAERDIGSLLVMEESGKPAGIFTDRDVVTRIVAHNLDADAVTVSEVMTGNIACANPAMTVGEAATILTQKRCHHLPVVADGKLVGVLSAGDIMQWVSKDHEEEIQELVSYISGSY